MVFAPGALALKQTDNIEKPIKWIPPPMMYLFYFYSFCFFIFSIFFCFVFTFSIFIYFIFNLYVPETPRDPVLEHHCRTAWSRKKCSFSLFQALHLPRMVYSIYSLYSYIVYK